MHHPARVEVEKEEMGQAEVERMTGKGFGWEGLRWVVEGWSGAGPAVVGWGAVVREEVG